jgi:hypothetical protein
MKLIIRFMAVLLMPMVVSCAAAASSYSREDISLALELVQKSKLSRDIKFRELAIEGKDEEYIEEIKTLISHIEKAKEIYASPNGEAFAIGYLRNQGIKQADRDIIIKSFPKAQEAKPKPKKSDEQRQAPKNVVIQVDPVVEKWAKELQQFDPDTQISKIAGALTKAGISDQLLRQQIMARIRQLRAGVVLQKSENEAPAQAKVEEQKAAKSLAAASNGMNDLFAQIRALKKDKEQVVTQELKKAQEARELAQTPQEQQKAEQKEEKARTQLELLLQKKDEYLEGLDALFAQQEALQQQLFDQAVSEQTKKMAQQALEKTKTQQENVAQEKEEVEQKLITLEQESITTDFMNYVEKHASNWMKHVSDNKQVMQDDVRKVLGEDFTIAQVLYVQGFLQAQL